MYSIKPVSGGFVVMKKVDERTEVRESEVYANLELPKNSWLNWLKVSPSCVA